MLTPPNPWQRGFALHPTRVLDLAFEDALFLGTCSLHQAPRPVLYGLSQVLRLYRATAIEIGYRPSHFQDAVETSCRQRQLLHGRAEQTLG